MSRDATQEELEQMSKNGIKAAKAGKKAWKNLEDKKVDFVEGDIPNEQIEIGFGDEINFTELFRLKGKRGLFTLRSQVNKAGMVVVIGFMDYNRKFTVKADDLICLGQLTFQREAGFDDLRMNDVFNNLFDYCHDGQVEAKDINKLMLDDLIDIMVPNYDPDKFKRYHAETVLSWYKEVFNKLKSIENERTDKEKN